MDSRAWGFVYLGLGPSPAWALNNRTPCPPPRAGTASCSTPAPLHCANMASRHLCPRPRPRPLQRPPPPPSDATPPAPSEAMLLVSFSLREWRFGSYFFLLLLMIRFILVRHPNPRPRHVPVTVPHRPRSAIRTVSSGNGERRYIPHSTSTIGVND
jgi:hypothetical protein